MTEKSMESTGIYRITNKINGKRYYGSAAGSFKKRWCTHKVKLRGNYHDNVHLQSAWNLYGIDAFEFEPILIVEPEWCIYFEQMFLDVYYDSGVNCYNMLSTAGSRLGAKCTPEQIEHNRQIQLAYWTPERKEAQSKKMMGTVQSPENVAKRIAKNTGQKRTDEVKAVLSAQKMGAKNPQYGKPTWNKGLRYKIVDGKRIYMVTEQGVESNE